MVVFRAEVLNIDDRKADREDPDLGLQWLYRLFGRRLVFEIFEYLLYRYL